MTETALIVASRNEFSTLSEESPMLEIMRENMIEGDSFSEQHLIRVKTPSGGALNWEIPNVNGAQFTREIEGLWLFQRKEGVLWPTLESTSGKQPVLHTTDLKTAIMRVRESEVPPEMLAAIKPFEISPGIYKWRELPYLQQGTGKKGVGTWGKESRILFILRKDDMWPLVVKIGPGSRKPFDAFVAQLDCVYHRAIISLSLREEISKTGQKYSQIVPAKKGIVDDATWDVSRSLFTERLQEAHKAGQLSVDVTE